MVDRTILFNHQGTIELKMWCSILWLLTLVVLSSVVGIEYKRSRTPVEANDSTKEIELNKTLAPLNELSFITDYGNSGICKSFKNSLRLRFVRISERVLTEENGELVESNNKLVVLWNFSVSGIIKIYVMLKLFKLLILSAIITIFVVVTDAVAGAADAAKTAAATATAAVTTAVTTATTTTTAAATITASGSVRVAQPPVVVPQDDTFGFQPNRRGRPSIMDAYTSPFITGVTPKELRALLYNTFLAGVQIISLDDLIRAYSSARPPRPPYKSPVSDTVQARALFVHASRAHFEAFENALKWWRAVFLEVQGGLEVMESIELRYMEPCQWEAGGIRERMDRFRSLFNANCKIHVGYTLQELKTSANAVSELYLKTDNFKNVFTRALYQSQVNSAARQIELFYENHERLSDFLLSSAVNIMQDYDKLVQIMKDRIVFNTVFTRILLEAAGADTKHGKLNITSSSRLQYV